VDFGSFRRLQPISQDYGLDRGLPVDRVYIEGFLQRHAADVRGRVLEIANNSYTLRFGADRVTRSDVLHVDPDHPGATFTGDLASSETLPSDTFDCFILTQTLQYIYDVPAAVATVYRALRPGGVVLATFPGITPTGGDGWPWHWSFTEHSARRCFEASFPPGQVEVRGYGNVLSAVAFLEGLAAAELRPAELAAHDPRYPVTYTVRAVKPGPG
jgi:SAM-dependent methyltransferase